MAWAEGQLGFAGGESVPHPMQGCPVLDRWAGWILGDTAGGRSGRGLSPAGLRQMLEGILGWMRRPGPAVEQEVGQPASGDPCYFRVRRGHGSLGGKLEGREGTRIAWGIGKTTLAPRPSVGRSMGTGWVHPSTIMSQNTQARARWQQLLLSEFHGADVADEAGALQDGGLPSVLWASRELRFSSPRSGDSAICHPPRISWREGRRDVPPSPADMAQGPPPRDLPWPGGGAHFCFACALLSPFLANCFYVVIKETQLALLCQCR